MPFTKKRVVTYARRRAPSKRNVATDVTLSPNTFDSSPVQKDAESPEEDAPSQSSSVAEDETKEMELDVFEFQEPEEYVPSYKAKRQVGSPKRITRSTSRSVPTSSPRPAEDSTPLSSPFKQIDTTSKSKEREPSSNMNYFIEAPKELKPQWSPRKTPTNSPVQKKYKNYFLIDTLDTPSKSLSQDDYSATPTPRRILKNDFESSPVASARKKLKFDITSLSPKEKQNISTTKRTYKGNDAWTLFDEYYQDQSPKKRATIDVLSQLDEKLKKIQEIDHTSEIDYETEMSEYGLPNHISNVFESLQNSVTNVNERSEDNGISPSKLPKNYEEFPDLNKRTYGAQRSYLAEIEESEADKKTTPKSEDILEDIEEKELITQNEQEEIFSQLKNINDLRAAGKSNEFVDEIDYLLEGLSYDDTSLQCSTLIDLALKLFDPNFASQLKSVGLPDSLISIIKKREDANILVSFFIVFIILKTLDKQQASILLKMKSVVISLMWNNESFSKTLPLKLTNITKLSFDDFLMHFCEEMYPDSKVKYTDGIPNISPSSLGLYCLHILLSQSSDHHQSLDFFLNDYNIISGLNNMINDSIDQQEKFAYEKLLIYIPILEYCFTHDISLPESDKILQKNMETIVNLFRKTGESSQEVKCLISSLRLAIILSSQEKFEKGSVLYGILYDPSVVPYLLDMVDNSCVMVDSSGSTITNNLALLSLGLTVNLIDDKGLCHLKFYEEDILKRLKDNVDRMNVECDDDVDERLHSVGYLCLLIGLLKMNCPVDKTTSLLSLFTEDRILKVRSGLKKFHGSIDNELGFGMKSVIEKVMKYLG